MYKRSALLLILVISVVLSSLTAFSAEDNNCTIVHNRDDSISISGKISESVKSKKLTAVIMKYGMDMDSAKDGESAAGIMEYVDTSYADRNGNWSFLWQPSALGEYMIHISAEGMGNIIKKQYYYYSQLLKDKLDNDLKSGTIEDLALMFVTEENVRTLGILTSDIADIENKENIGKFLYYIRKVVGAGKIEEYFDNAFDLSRYVQNKTTGDLDNAVKILSGLGIELKDYEFYKAIAESDIKEEIAKEFADVVISDLTDCSTNFNNTVVLNGIEKNILWSSISPYLELMNYDVYNKSTNKAKIAQAVVGNTYTISELKSAIDKADKQSGGNSAGGGTGGGGGGGSSSGGGGGSSSGGGSGFTGGKAGQSVVIEKDEENTETKKDEVLKTTFSDVNESHWAYKYINHLKWKGVIQDGGENMFFPDKNISRAEMLAMLCRAFNVEGEAKNVFTDVSPSDWYYSYVTAAYSNELVTGYEDGSFKADELISRQDMAVMVYRFAVKYGRSYEGGGSYFNDSDMISDYAKEAVEKLSSAGIVNGMEDGAFSPMDNATRAQVAKLIYGISE